MEGLVQPDRLRHRIMAWADEEIALGLLPAKAGSILEDADAVVSTGERQARRIASSLVEKGVPASDNPRAPLRLVFPATLAGRWMPGLFPEQAS